MHCNMRPLWVAVTASAVAGLLAGGPAPAQKPPPSVSRVTTRPAAEVLAQIGQSAGVVVLADSTVQARLPVQAGAATPDTVDQQVAAMVRLLPAGTVWVKLYVPAPAKGRWNGDIVAEYARAEARLVGPVGRSTPPGTVEILGRPLPADKASEYAAALNLKLVYLVTTPRAPSASGYPLGQVTAANWGQLTPEQRTFYAQQQAQRLLALDPVTRLQTLRQLMQEATPQQMIVKMTLSQMTDDERIQFKQSLTEGTGKPGTGK